MVVALLAGLGWTLLGLLGSGGIDVGGLAVGSGPTGNFVAVAGAAILGALAAWWARRSPGWRSRPALLALGAAGGLTAWSALSILWASAPDLAWLEANRGALAVAGLALGISLTALADLTPQRLAVATTVAATPVAIWALVTKIAPTAVGAEADPARLAEPIGYANGLALVAAIALPGALWVAGRRRATRAHLAIGSCAATVLFLVVLMTYSRSGLVALAVGVALCLWMSPLGRRAVAALLAGAAGAILPAAHALTAPGLTQDAALAAARRDAGLGLAWRLALGLAIAAGVALALDRIPVPPRAAALARRVLHPRAVLTALGAAVAAFVVVLAAVPAFRDRVGSALDGDAGLTDTASRGLSIDANHRIDWWAESLRGFADAPLIGHGAGSFPLTHLQERDGGTVVRQPHQLLLQVMTELGVVGAALLVALVAGIVWAAVRARRQGRGPTLGLALAIVGPFLVQAQLDWSWSIPALMIPAMVAAGVVLAAAAPAAGPRGRSWPAWTAGVLAGLALLVGVSASLPWASGRDLDKAYRLAGEGDLRGALKEARRAGSHNPLSIEPLVARGIVLTAAREDDAAARVLEEATRLQPENARAWRQLARTLTRAGDTGRAAAAQRRADALDPRSAPAPAP